MTGATEGPRPTALEDRELAVASATKQGSHDGSGGDADQDADEPQPLA